MELIEWCTHYITFKDCMKKNIQEMTSTEHHIIVKEKERTITYHIYEDLQQGIEQLNKNQEVLVTVNTKKNFDILIQQWNVLVSHRQLTVLFAHPNLNQKWLVHPFTHNTITEEKSLKEGLNTLFESIPRV